MLPRADVVVLILPASAETRGLIGSRQLALMRQGALLVNAARGPIVDTDALVEALKSGRIRAALDVTDPEPLPEGHPLWSCPNLLITPHVGASTPQFSPRALRIAAEELKRYMNGEPLQNVVQAAVFKQRCGGAAPVAQAEDSERDKPGIEHSGKQEIFVDVLADVDGVHDNPEPPVGDVLARPPPTGDKRITGERSVEMRQCGVHAHGECAKQKTSRRARGQCKQ